MKILIFAGSFLPFLGGYENLIYNLSLKLIEDGHSVDILTMNTEKTTSFEFIDGIRVYRIPCWNALNRTFPIPKLNVYSLRLIYKLYKRDYDLINTHTRFFITSLIGVIFANIKKLPCIHVEHGSTHSVLENKIIFYTNRVYDHSVGSFIIKSSTASVGVSKESCNFLKHLGANNPILIPDGIDTDVFKSMSTSLKSKLCIEDNKVIVVVGRLVYSKGIQDLIKIVPTLIDVKDDLNIIIVGDGPYKDRLQQMTPAKYKKNVLFLGTKTPYEIIEILSIADIFVNLSYSEGFGITVLEAASVGLPIIATRVGIVPELIEDYKTGISINPGDTEHLLSYILELIKDPILCDYLASNIKDRVKKDFDWKSIVVQYSNLFERCLV